jgi:hypothetical protein
MGYTVQNKRSKKVLRAQKTIIEKTWKMCSGCTFLKLQFAQFTFNRTRVRRNDDAMKSLCPVPKQ